MTLQEKFQQAVKMDLASLIKTLQVTPELAQETDDNGCSLLFFACARSDYEKIIVLLGDTKDPNQPNNYGVYPIEAFVNAANAGVKTADNYTDLILQILLESGVKPTQKAINRAVSLDRPDLAAQMTAKMQPKI